VVISYLNGLEGNIKQIIQPFSNQNNDPMIAVNNGREIQIDDWQ
jgi:hypothetical protein